MWFQWWFVSKAKIILFNRSEFWYIRWSNIISFHYPPLKLGGYIFRGRCTSGVNISCIMKVICVWYVFFWHRFVFCTQKNSAKQMENCDKFDNKWKPSTVSTVSIYLKINPFCGWYGYPDDGDMALRPTDNKLCIHGEVMRYESLWLCILSIHIFP